VLPIDSLTAFIIASTLLGLAPGPDNLFVLTQSALFGRKAGILVTAGLCSGLIVHTAIVAFGVAAIFQTSVIAFSLLKFMGALYLFYLAWQAFTASSQHLHKKPLTILSSRQLYRRGIIMNISNPKVSIFFLAFLTQFTAAENGPVIYQLFLLGAVFMLITFLLFSSIALLAGMLSNWLKHSPGAQIYLNRIAGSVFIALAINLIMVEMNH
jgi:threonine/homoserine/homoserine lactone efflux protein